MVSRVEVVNDPNFLFLLVKSGRGAAVRLRTLKRVKVPPAQFEGYGRDVDVTQGPRRV